ncbi:hypothetical protein ACO2Q8_27090 [Larkinella sp. VNQ87]|uniref:hypothetical protein n=1 Tax=Larkinella sp. VNQ87 TaxID=3400921 RepID=UPI003C0B7258
MKTILNVLLVVFTLTLACVSVSQADPHKPIGRPKKVAAFQSGIYTTAEGKLQIALDKENGGTVLVQLTDEAGNELFAQKFHKRRQVVRLRLDVRDLPDGVYQVVISNGQESTVQTFAINTRQSVISPRSLVIH